MSIKAGTEPGGPSVNFGNRKVRARNPAITSGNRLPNPWTATVLRFNGIRETGLSGNHSPWTAPVPGPDGIRSTGRVETAHSKAVAVFPGSCSGIQYNCLSVQFPAFPDWFKLHIRGT